MTILKSVAAMIGSAAPRSTELHVAAMLSRCIIEVASMPVDRFLTEPTTHYWQDLADDIPSRFAAEAPFRFAYPVRLPDSRVLMLPLRQLRDGDIAVASLIANHASMAVVSALADHMVALAKAFRAEIIVGLPTLGLAFAPLMASRLAQTRYAPLGYSRKFWYDDELSEPVHSITSPDAGKYLRLDTNLVPLLEGRKVLLVDDAISTGATAVSAVRLLDRMGARVCGMVVAMKQTSRWQAAIAALPCALTVRAVVGCPLFRREDDGWHPIADTEPEIP